MKGNVTSSHYDLILKSISYYWSWQNVGMYLFNIVVKFLIP
jgi:hypothetical protein